MSRVADGPGDWNTLGLHGRDQLSRDAGQFLMTLDCLVLSERIKRDGYIQMTNMELLPSAVVRARHSDPLRRRAAETNRLRAKEAGERGN
jgi:hypothetical protein